MDRRKALKNIGTGMGAIAVTPTVVSLFQSCQTATGYTPAFVPQEDFGGAVQFNGIDYPSHGYPWGDRAQTTRISGRLRGRGLEAKKTRRVFATMVGPLLKRSAAESFGERENASQLTLRRLGLPTR